MSSKNNSNSLNPDYFYLPFPKFNEEEYEKLANNKLINKFIFGPTFVPFFWNFFPYQSSWKEKRFSEILSKIKGLVIHSERVRDYLAIKSNTTNKLNNYIIMRACTNIKPNKVKSFKKRKIDILFFEKYGDLNREKQGEELMNLLNKTNKIIARIQYGKYNKTIMTEYANDSKFIIYFSFYDTGAIGLKEIQNYGVFAFTLQKDLVIDKETTFYIPELSSQDTISLASQKIIKIIDIISEKKPNSELIAKKNQMINRCENSLKDLCKRLLNS